MSKHYQEAEALRKRARIALEQAHDAAAESSPSGDICRISAAVETLADVVDDLSSLLCDVLEAGDAKPTKPKASPTDAEALDLLAALKGLLVLIEHNGLGRNGAGKPSPYEPTTEGIKIMAARAAIRAAEALQQPTVDL